MKPSQVASILRRIATTIEKSRNPDKNLVARDLKKIVAAINPNFPDDSILEAIGNVDMMRDMIHMTGKRQEPSVYDPDEFFNQVIWAYAEDADALTEQQRKSLRETFDKAFAQYVGGIKFV